MALAAYDDRPIEEQLSQEQQKRAREEKLARMLKAEEEEALGFAQTEIIEQQIEALDRYMGKLYGDEEDGRSQVTTREVFETIEWTRPDLMRVFASGGNVVTVEESSPEDAKYAKDAADYLQWVFFSDNDGFENLDDFGFDGLLHRRGYLANYWVDDEYQAPQHLTGLTDEHLMQFVVEEAEGKLQIMGHNLDQESASEAGGIELVVRRMKSPARAEIVSIAPEDMRLNGRAVKIDDARYVGRVVRMLRGEIVRKWPDKRDEVKAYSGGAGHAGNERRSEDVRAARFNDDDSEWETQSNEAAQELEVLEEYLRVDLDGDDYPELIRCYRLGDIILEEGEVEENPFWTWTPKRVPHRFMGLSVHDTTSDLQRQSTVITRAGLDALYQSVVNREAYDKNTVDLDSLLATYSGAKVAVDGPPGDKILPLTGGLNTATVAWEALEVIKRRLEDRTGATRQTRGIDSDSISKEHSGKALDKLQINADAQKELVARNMANGLARGFGKLYRLLCRNQNRARAVKIGGKWAEFDPRTWNSDLRITIHPGGVNREAALMGLSLIGQEQANIIETLGPANPNVTMKNRYRYQEELCRLAGHKSAEPFFTEVPDEPVTDEQGQPQIDPQTGQPATKPWAPPPQPDPAMAKVQQDGQIALAEMQLKGQEAAATLQLQQQKDTAAIEASREKAALELQLTREKAAAEIEVTREKAAAEMQLAREKMALELALERERMQMEGELERERIASQERIGKEAALSKNREGGSLAE